MPAASSLDEPFALCRIRTTKTCHMDSQLGGHEAGQWPACEALKISSAMERRRSFHLIQKGAVFPAESRPAACRVASYILGLVPVLLARTIIAQNPYTVRQWASSVVTAPGVAERAEVFCVVEAEPGGVASAPARSRDSGRHGLRSVLDHLIPAWPRCYGLAPCRQAGRKRCTRLLRAYVSDSGFDARGSML